MRAVFLVLLAVISVAFLSMGCATSMLWKAKYEHLDYNETVDAFMVTSDNLRIVFLGRSYHYIFTQDPKFAYLLKNRDKNEITFDVKKGSYSVNGSSASALFSVYIDPKSNDTELLKWLADNRIFYNKQKQKYYYSVSLRGERYKSDPKINERAVKLEDPIVINVNETKQVQDGAVSTLAKLVATPITIVADGVMVVGAVVLLPIFLIASGR